MPDANRETLRLFHLAAGPVLAASLVLQAIVPARAEPSVPCTALMEYVKSVDIISADILDGQARKKAYEKALNVLAARVESHVGGSDRLMEILTRATAFQALTELQRRPPPDWRPGDPSYIGDENRMAEEIDRAFDRLMALCK